MTLCGVCERIVAANWVKRTGSRVRKVTFALCATKLMIVQRSAFMVAMDPRHENSCLLGTSRVRIHPRAGGGKRPGIFASAKKIKLYRNMSPSNRYIHTGPFNHDCKNAQQFVRELWGAGCARWSRSLSTKCTLKNMEA